MNSPLELKAEVRLPLEIVANLIYLTKHHSDDAGKVTTYMNLAEKAFADLILALTQQSEDSML